MTNALPGQSSGWRGGGRLAAWLRDRWLGVPTAGDQPISRLNDLLLAWLGLVFVVTLATLPLVAEEALHYRAYYLLGAAPLLLLVLTRPAYWRQLTRSVAFLGLLALIVYLVGNGLLVGDVTLKARYDVLRYGILALSFVFGVVVVSRRYPGFPWLLMAGLALAGGITGAFYAGEHLWEWGGHGGLPRLRFHEGYIDNPNRIAVVYAPLALMGAVLALKGRSSWTVTALWLCASLGSLAVVVLAQTRGALVGLVVAGAAFLVLERRWKVLLGLVLTALLFVVAVETVLPIRDFTSRVWAIESRLLIWQSVLDRIAEAPIWGEGWGTGNQVYVEARDRWWPHTHSSYLEVTMQAGLVGAIVLVAAIASWLWAGYRRRLDEPWAVFGLVGLVYWLVHSLVASRISLDGVHREWIYLLLPVAFIVVGELRARHEPIQGRRDGARPSWGPSRLHRNPPGD